MGFRLCLQGGDDEANAWNQRRNGKNETNDVERGNTTTGTEDAAQSAEFMYAWKKFQRSVKPNSKRRRKRLLGQRDHKSVGRIRFVIAELCDGKCCST